MKKIKLFDPYIDKNEEFALLKSFKSKFWASGQGTGNVKKFEKNFCKYISASSCIAVNSGTAALHLALSLFDIKNKEVLLPSLSFVTTAHAILYNGGIPKFVDVDPHTLCIDTINLEKSISKKTKMILPVHFAGYPSNLDSISKLCKKFNLISVEDAAHAAGTTYKNQKIGSHSNAVCFSFHPVKNLAMPGGGIISLNKKNISKNEKLLKSKRWCGITNRKSTNYDVEYLGWNFYMNEFSASIGNEQLKKLDKMNAYRKNIAKKYNSEIATENKIPFSKDCSYHIYWILVKNRKFLIKKMNEMGVELGIHYKPIHKMNFYKSKLQLDVTEKIEKEIVSIPIHPNLTEANIQKIIKLINQYGKF